MLIPLINESTIENLTNEFLRTNPLDYVKEKVYQLKEENPLLLGCIAETAEIVFVQEDDAPEEDKLINKWRAIAFALLVLNIVNTEMEIEWLKDE